MDFQCDRCGQKYHVADEKLQGRAASRFKCKKCENIILLSPSSAASTPPAPTFEPSSPAARPAPSALRAPTATAPVRPGVAAPPAATPRVRSATSTGPAFGAKPPPAAPVARASMAPATPQDEHGWFAGVHEQPSGPLSRAQLAQYVQDGAVNGDTLVWRDGFADWRPLRLVPALKDLVPATVSSPPSFADNPSLGESDGDATTVSSGAALLAAAMHVAGAPKGEHVGEAPTRRLSALTDEHLRAIRLPPVTADKPAPAAAPSALRSATPAPTRPSTAPPAPAPTPAVAKPAAPARTPTMAPLAKPLGAPVSPLAKPLGAPAASPLAKPLGAPASPLAKPLGAPAAPAAKGPEAPAAKPLEPTPAPAAKPLGAPASPLAKPLGSPLGPKPAGAAPRPPTAPSSLGAKPGGRLSLVGAPATAEARPAEAPAVVASPEPEVAREEVQPAAAPLAAQPAAVEPPALDAFAPPAPLMAPVSLALPEDDRTQIDEALSAPPAAPAAPAVEDEKPTEKAQALQAPAAGAAKGWDDPLFHVSAPPAAPAAAAPATSSWNDPVFNSLPPPSPAAVAHAPAAAIPATAPGATTGQIPVTVDVARQKPRGLPKSAWVLAAGFAVVGVAGGIAISRKTTPQQAPIAAAVTEPAAQPSVPTPPPAPTTPTPAVPTPATVGSAQPESPDMVFAAPSGSDARDSEHRGGHRRPAAAPAAVDTAARQRELERMLGIGGGASSPAPVVPSQPTAVARGAQEPTQNSGSQATARTAPTPAPTARDTVREREAADRLERSGVVRRCWEQFKLRNPAATARRLTINVAVAESGAVALRVAGTTDEALSSCIENRSSTVRSLGAGNAVRTSVGVSLD